MRNLIGIIFCLLITSCGEERIRVQDPYQVPSETSEAGSVGVQSENTFTGEDINGSIRTCDALDPQAMCTQVFTESDQYARDCEKLGFIAIQCGCHDWICVNN